MLYSRWKKKKRHKVEPNLPSQRKTEVIIWLVSPCGSRYGDVSWWICVQTTAREHSSKEPRKVVTKENNPSLELTLL